MAGYSLLLKEYASAALGRRTLISHSNTTAQAQVQDVKNNVTYTLIQNTTYPNGLCTASTCVPSPRQNCSGGLQGLESFYSLGAGNPISFDGKNVLNVRGISCERWSRAISMTPPSGRGPPQPMTAIAYFYFPVSSWSNRGESFHRLLKRIAVNGTSRRSGNFSHSYEFVDMVPAVSNADVFDPCLVLHSGPMGVPLTSAVTGCGCESRFPQVCAAPAPATPAPALPSSSSNGGLIAAVVILPLIALASGYCLGRRSPQSRKGGPEFQELTVR